MFFITFKLNVNGPLFVLCKNQIKVCFHINIFKAKKNSFVKESVFRYFSGHFLFVRTLARLICPNAFVKSMLVSFSGEKDVAFEQLEC